MHKNLRYAVIAFTTASCMCFAQAKPAQKFEKDAAPATKMEAFQPSAGSVITFGYDNLNRVMGIEVDVREIKDSRGASARGLLVKVTQSEYSHESSFVDADEIPELIKGFDAILSVSENPTKFSKFEVRYRTKGGLQLTAFNSSENKINYAVQAGEISTSQTFLNASQMDSLKASFQAAQDKLHSL